MQRIMIIGPGNSGKSTLAIKLGQELNLPVYHIDQFAWKENWQAATKAEKKARHDEIIAGNKWILEGNAPSTLADRIKRADTLIFVDMSTPILMFRWFRRLYRNRGKIRPDMGGGNIERFNLEYLRWLMKYPRKAIIDQLKSGSAGKELYILRGKRKVDSFIHSQGA